MDLPRQGRPLLLGEGSGCAQTDVQPIQRSLAYDNQSVLQILQAPLVQPASATIPIVHAIAESHVVDVEGEMMTTMEGIPRVPTILWIATTCLFCKTTSCCTHTIARIA